MNISRITETLDTLNIRPDEIADERLAEVFRILLLLIEELCEEIEKSKEEKQKLRDEVNLLNGAEILSPGNIYQTLFSQLLDRRVTSYQDFHYEGRSEKEVGDALAVLKNAGLINASGNVYYPTSYGLRKARKLNISETPRAWL